MSLGIIGLFSDILMYFQVSIIEASVLEWILRIHISVEKAQDKEKVAFN